MKLCKDCAHYRYVSIPTLLIDTPDFPSTHRCSAPQNKEQGPVTGHIVWKYGSDARNIRLSHTLCGEDGIWWDPASAPLSPEPQSTPSMFQRVIKIFSKE